LLQFHQSGGQELDSGVEICGDIGGKVAIAPQMPRPALSGRDPGIGDTAGRPLTDTLSKAGEAEGLSEFRQALFDLVRDALQDRARRGWDGVVVDGEEVRTGLFGEGRPEVLEGLIDESQANSQGPTVMCRQVPSVHEEPPFGSRPDGRPTDRIR
jgi:hypothetical protein